MSYPSSSFSAFHSEPQHAIQAPSTAERWLRGNSGRTIYTAHFPNATNSIAVNSKQPSPTQPAFGSENAPPVFAGDFDLFVPKTDAGPSTQPFEEIPRPERTPLGNTSNFPSSISGISDLALDFDNAVAQLQYATDYVRYGRPMDFEDFERMSGLGHFEPTLNGTFDHRYRRCRSPEPAPYERSVEEEGLLKCVEPHWLTLRQPVPPPANAEMAYSADASAEPDVASYDADNMSDDGSAGSGNSFFGEGVDDSIGSVSSVASSRECSASLDDATYGDAVSSRSSSPASSVDESSEEEYLPLARDIRVHQVSRKLKRSQNRHQPYPATRPRRNIQVDDDDDEEFDLSRVVPPGALHPSLSSLSSSSRSSDAYASSMKNAKKKKTTPELPPGALSCPICDYGGDDIDASGRILKGLSSERRRTLSRHYASHFSSSRVICEEKPNPDGEGTIGGCRKPLSRPDALKRHYKTCPGPPPPEDIEE
ncbi:hypothetical protein SCHPADRAFT_941723 [Schizopora paradoxa]|uniref:Uncharacterized protein n=1 Tax=Schizopora paradoxa TaxID=27342 RepID=A0A0H2RII0_9AGAM|nr:hypothetical protein SCHPADRAFT_941723 [Schizopora paradoxa]